MAPFIWTPMDPLRKILGQFTEGLGIESGIVLTAVRRKWTDIVGPAIAAHTFPDTIRDKALTIIVDTPQWMHHLSFYKEEISEKLRFCNMQGVRFKLGRLPEKADTSLRREEAELTDEDLRFLENTIGNIKDEELREKFRKLIVHGLTKGKERV
ncbi:MAG: DUF721 domain-containing protein [Nitrospirae bacterium]|nr:DUF721 domain-containing protein [Nitrospirota bacterium]